MSQESKVAQHSSPAEPHQKSLTRIPPDITECWDPSLGSGPMSHCPLHVTSPASRLPAAAQQERKEALTPLRRDRDSSGEWQRSPLHVGKTGCDLASCEQEGIRSSEETVGPRHFWCLSPNEGTQKQHQEREVLLSALPHNPGHITLSLCSRCCKRSAEGCTCRVLCKCNALCQSQLALPSTRRGWM